MSLSREALTKDDLYKLTEITKDDPVLRLASILHGIKVRREMIDPNWISSAYPRLLNDILDEVELRLEEMLDLCLTKEAKDDN